MDKTTRWSVRPVKTQISLGIRPVWSESSLSAWRKLRSLATHKAHSKDLIRLGRCPGWSESSLGAWVILLVLSCIGLFKMVPKFQIVWSYVSNDSIVLLVTENLESEMWNIYMYQMEYMYQMTVLSCLLLKILKVKCGIFSEQLMMVFGFSTVF